MNQTPAFLSQRDRDALRKQYRRGEKPVRIVQADLDGRVGLLAVTDRRVLFVARRALKTFVREVPRANLARVTQRTERYGSIVLKTKGGDRFEFWMLERGAAQAALEALVPRAAKGAKGGTGPTDVTFQASSKPAAGKPAAPGRPVASADAPVQTPRRAPRPAPASQPSTRDGSSYLPQDSVARRDRLQRQLEMGIITRSEYDWQLESLRRA